MSLRTRKLPAPAKGEQQQETSQPVETATDDRRFRRLARLGRHIPTLTLMAMLIGLGIYGHHSGWKLPKFSALTGNGIAARDDWCEEHVVPESQCVECNPDLLPRGKDYGWCKEHGVDNCPLHNPEVAQLKQTPILSDADGRRGAGASRGPAAGEQPCLQELPPPHPVRIPGRGEEGGRGCFVGGSTANR